MAENSSAMQKKYMGWIRLDPFNNFKQKNVEKSKKNCGKTIDIQGKRCYHLMVVCGPTIAMPI